MSYYPPPPGTNQQYYQSSPAYHPVQEIRQTFGQAPPSYAPIMPQPIPAPPAVDSNKVKVAWSEGVRGYVQRAFLIENMVADIPRAAVEKKLHDMIAEAKDNGTLDTTPWDTMATPQQLIRQDNLKALMWQQPPNTVNQSNGNGMPTNQTLISKKRKSQEVGDEESASVPWRTNNHVGFEDRLSKRQQPFQPESTNKGTSKLQKQLEKRQRKFDGGYKSTYKSPSPEPVAGPCVGTSEVLEKRYFRLTAAPIPSQVRPERILRQTLDLLKEKWKKEGNYGYICDQFKSMRQDLTVQRVRNDLTVSVYEIHARIALEKGDLGEYNQCQTQLRVLYAQKLGGHPVEFKAYRILYFIHTSNRTALNDVLADLTVAEKAEKAIKHALDVRSALALGNYHQFFRLYLDTPNMGAYLMDMFVVRERLAALSNICKAYKPDVKLRFITEELGFESDLETATFIHDYNGEQFLNERDSDLYFLSGKAGPTFEAAKRGAFAKVDLKGQI